MPDVALGVEDLMINDAAKSAVPAQLSMGWEINLNRGVNSEMGK